MSETDYNKRWDEELSDAVYKRNWAAIIKRKMAEDKIDYAQGDSVFFIGEENERIKNNVLYKFDKFGLSGFLLSQLYITAIDPDSGAAISLERAAEFRKA